MMMWGENEKWALSSAIVEKFKDGDSKKWLKERESAKTSSISSPVYRIAINETGRGERERETTEIQLNATHRN